MKKYIALIIVLLIGIAAGIVASLSVLFGNVSPPNTGVIRDISIIIQKNSWSFDPDVIRVSEGDMLRLRIINGDVNDHGIAIDSYGISERVPAHSTSTLPSFLAINPGSFLFYDPIPAPSGIARSGTYKGEERSYLDELGVLQVDPYAERRK